MHGQEDVLRVPELLQVSLNIDIDRAALLQDDNMLAEYVGYSEILCYKCISLVIILALWMIQINAVTKSLWEYLQRKIDSIPLTFLLIQTLNTYFCSIEILKDLFFWRIPK